jgi:hypothetical protein
MLVQRETRNGAIKEAGAEESPTAQWDVRRPAVPHTTKEATDSMQCD